jgi:hypothetical protein
MGLNKTYFFQAHAIAANYRDEFEVAKVGDRVIFHSNLFGFTFMIDDQGDIQIMVYLRLNNFRRENSDFEPHIIRPPTNCKEN